jgi:hypothetical protein
MASGDPLVQVNLLIVRGLDARQLLARALRGLFWYAAATSRTVDRWHPVPPGAGLGTVDLFVNFPDRIPQSIQITIFRPLWAALLVEVCRPPVREPFHNRLLERWPATPQLLQERRILSGCLRCMGSTPFAWS